MDPLNVYQRRLAQRGAQHRMGQAYPGLLEPVGEVGPPLTVREEANGPVVRLGLKDAILRAVAQNTDIRVVAFDPAVSREEMIEAAAAFDVVASGSYQQARTHELARNTSFLTTQPFIDTRSEGRVLKAGLKELTPTGGTWSVTYAMTRQWDNSLFSIVPTTYEPTVVLEVAQPLLRDAWPQFNLSRLRIAQTNEKVGQQDFRAKVEEIVSDVITAYWTLWATRQEVLVRQDLLGKAQETLRKVRLRAPIDAAAAEIRQSEAAVKEREVLLDDAIKTVWDAQDQLVRLLDDPQINLLGQFQVEPADLPAQTRVVLEEAGELRTALEHNPVLAKARLAITLAEINVDIARNQTLPRLDLTASAGYQGLGRTWDQGSDKLATFDFLDYSLGLALEYPLGNRERLAELRKQRLLRLKAVSQLQGVADQLAVSVKERVREVARAYHEIELDREVVEAFRLQLQALEDVEKIRGLTPEFLNLKLNTQSSLADAQIAELRAVRAYNLAQSDLDRTTGTILKKTSVDILLPAAAGEASWPRETQPPASAPATSTTPASGATPAGTPSSARPLRQRPRQPLASN
jgi:outer membrane protein TolC